jgi:hypothetical protein
MAVRSPRNVFILVLAVLPFHGTPRADDLRSPGLRIVRAANAWHLGEPIPSELRHYRKGPGDLGDPMDSEILISAVKNLPLLAALAIDVAADPECREDAFAQGMYAGGPTRFFGIVERDLDADPAHRDPWLDEVRRRIGLAHVVVDALTIDDGDMQSEERERVLDRIERELRGGGRWDTMFERYRVGNLGHFVVFGDPALRHGRFVDIGPHTITWQGEELPRRLRRLEFFDAAHLPAILRSAKGAILRLHSTDYHETVLYQVQEVYPGTR